MKELLKSIGDFLRKIFGSVNELLEDKSPVAVRVAQWVKEAIEDHNGSIEWILAKTETEGDDEAYQFVKDKLPALIKELSVIDGLVSEDTSVDEAYSIYVTYIKGKVKESRAKEWIFLAAEILGAIIGKKAPIQALIMVTQKAYQILFGKV